MTPVVVDIHDFQFDSIRQNSVITIIGNKQSGKKTLAYYLADHICQINESKLVVLTCDKKRWTAKTNHVYDVNFTTILNQLKKDQVDAMVNQLKKDQQELFNFEHEHLTIIIDNLSLAFLETSISLHDFIINSRHYNTDMIILCQIFPKLEEFFINTDHWFFTSPCENEIRKLTENHEIGLALCSVIKSFDILIISPYEKIPFCHFKLLPM